MKIDAREWIKENNSYIVFTSNYIEDDNYPSMLHALDYYYDIYKVVQIEEEDVSIDPAANLYTDRIYVKLPEDFKEALRLVVELVGSGVDDYQDIGLIAGAKLEDNCRWLRIRFFYKE